MHKSVMGEIDDLKKVCVCVVSCTLVCINLRRTRRTFWPPTLTASTILRARWLLCFFVAFFHVL